MSASKRKRGSPDRYADEDLEDSSDDNVLTGTAAAPPSAATPTPSANKKQQRAPVGADAAVATKRDATEWEIGAKRKVSVSRFRNQLKIDIREYYEKDGQLLPGRKGISLNVEQWQSLKDIIGQVDAALAQ